MTGKFARLRPPSRPLHPPFTHFPIAGYVFAAAFDLVSAIAGAGHQWAAGLWHSGTFVVGAGLASCLVTMGTGFWDLVRFPPRSPRAFRVTAVHVGVMGGVFMTGAGDLAWRLHDYGLPAAPPGVVVLSLAVAALVCWGAWLGGTLVFEHGWGVAGQSGRARDAAGQESAAGTAAGPGDAPDRAGDR
jgi:uncharacterized membrane protein